MNIPRKIIIENLSIDHCDKVVNAELPVGLVYVEGKNGSGKTIFMDYIGKIREVHDGTIRGNDSIIYINQTEFFSPKLCGNDLLMFVYGLDKTFKNTNEFWRQYPEYVYNLDLKNLMKKRWGLLSGGEKKLIYILVLISLNRDWYILDEPFANLDVKKKEILWNIITRKKDSGKGIIITSHEQENRLRDNADLILNL